MNKATFFIIQLFYNNKTFAIVERIPNCENLARKHFNFNYCLSVNVADSKKEAVKIANYWNEIHKDELLNDSDYNAALKLFYSGV